MKNTKTRKVTKSRKWKSDKINKSENWKSDKNSEKKGGTRKRPKCHLNGQNRHFVKSEPPGPALFEFQGVPRDPVLRPKSTPLFLNVKCDHIFLIYHFVKYAFWWFWCFHVCDKLVKCGEVTFLTQCTAMVIRPYCNYTVGRVRVMCGGSPLIGLFLVSFVLLFNSMSGRLHRRGD